MVFLILLLSLLFAANAAPVPAPINDTCWNCRNETYSSSSSYSAAVDNLLAELITNAPITGYFQTTTQTADLQLTVYGLLQCRYGMSRNSCDQCSRAVGLTIKSRCASSVGAGFLLYGCYLRYENYPFFDVLDESLLCVNCSDASSSLDYFQNLKTAMSTLSIRGENVFSSTVGSGNTQVFVLGECGRGMSSQQCDACKSVVATNLTDKCGGRSGGSILLSSCYARFENFKFFNEPVLLLESRSPTPGEERRLKFVFLGLGSTLFLGIVLYCCVRNRRWLSHSARKKVEEERDLQATIHQGATIFQYHILKAATNSFSDENKLGEGGFGVVYKGVLPDGRKLAIKRLTTVSPKSRQEFLNEVKLVSSVQHRNLVKLYGCCVEDSERLLVYELLENNSLSRVLFGTYNSSEAEKVTNAGGVCLSWKQRYNVVVGVARGLAYLHQDSQVRIVHRDIKAANVLLDDKFEAKIADFGLARLYSGEQSINTQIAGTLGYMAPEYALHGHLTDKADVFSFGVLSLEIVSGRRSTDLNQPMGRQYLLEWAWKLHESNQLLDLLDKKIVDSPQTYDEEEAKRVICVGLLCAQASPSRRPSMSRVLTMICGEAKLGDVSRPVMLDLVDGVLKTDSQLSSYSQGALASQGIYSAR